MSETLETELDQIHTLLDKRLKLSGPLPEALPRARRYLPHRLRKAAQELLAAQECFENPRIARTLDEDRLVKKARSLKAYLAGIDLRDRRKGRLLDLGATIGFALLSVIALLVLVLRWRGFV
ncbi:hypothetical protein [Phaeobacter sp. HF9A]|uniref:hypothetical protein n=1 Tax=Phaeobacter sp. HF9A TaxID=2721561 RepID=UPI00142F6EA8|nr:hypothetical protein [Phaeobacter sp. HF9A]NIZ14033.1 hypothetical protein [Phaeobacter sp. HF9A]